MSKPKPLDPRTLRWAARKAAKYERELSDTGQVMRSLAAFVLRLTYVNEAKRLERKARK